MKTIKLFAVAAIAALCMTACDKQQGGGSEPDPSTKDYNLTTQKEVDGFTATTANNVTISGSVFDLSGVKLAQVNNLTIKNSQIEEIQLTALTTIKGNLEVSNNASLKSIKNLATKFASANITVKDNEVLDDIQGFLNLKQVGGTMSFTGNHALGADDGTKPDTYGFNVLRKLMNDQVIAAAKIILSDNHPDAATDPSQIGQKGEKYLSYTIKKASDLEAIDALDKTCKNLTVEGAQVDNQLWSEIVLKIEHILGDVVVDGCAITTTENFFEKILVDGSITLKNLEGYEEVGGSKLFNLNGLKGYTKINGNFTMINVPYAAHWGSPNCLTNIAEVTGNLTIENCGMQQLALAGLVKVGGNLIIRNNSLYMYTGYFWNLAMPLTTIGGDLVYSYNNHVNSLNGFDNITSIGGNIEIKANGTCSDPDHPSHEILYEDTPDGRGFALVQEWINKGYVKSSANIDCTTVGGEKVEFTRE